MESDILSVFCNPVRLKMLYCISKGSINVRQLVAKCGLAQSAVSQHLMKLKNADLVRADRKGRYMYYSLTNKKTGSMASELIDFAAGFGQPG